MAASIINIPRITLSDANGNTKTVSTQQAYDYYAKQGFSAPKANQVTASNVPQTTPPVANSPSVAATPTTPPITKTAPVNPTNNALPTAKTTPVTASTTPNLTEQQAQNYQNADQEIQSTLGNAINKFTANPAHDWNSPEGQALHQQAEQIRSKYGFSGGASGNEYNLIQMPAIQRGPTDSLGFSPPVYNDPYADQVKQILQQLQSIQPYNSPYATQINQLLSQMQNNQFNYNPATDQNLINAQNQAEHNVMENMNARGVLNSTLTADRSAQEAQKLIPQYEQMAYNKYQDTINNQYKNLTFLQNLDSQAYNQYNGGVQKMYDMANYINGLEGKSYNQYKDTVNNYYKEVDANLQSKRDDIAAKEKQIQDAWTRVQNLGYADNQAAAILNITPGTPSAEVQKQVMQQQHDLQMKAVQIQAEQEAKQKEYNQQVKLQQMKESADQELESQRANSAANLETQKETAASKLETQKQQNTNANAILSDVQEIRKAGNSQINAMKGKVDSMGKPVYTDQQIEDYKLSVDKQIADYVTNSSILDTKQVEILNQLGIDLSKLK